MALFVTHKENVVTIVTGVAEQIDFLLFVFLPVIESGANEFSDSTRPGSYSPSLLLISSRM